MVKDIILNLKTIIKSNGLSDVLLNIEAKDEVQTISLLLDVIYSENLVHTQYPAHKEAVNYHQEAYIVSPFVTQAEEYLAGI